MKIIYLRVSKEDPELQDIEPQLDKLTEKYDLDLNECKILEERGSAYDLDKLPKRKQFQELISLLFQDESISNIFGGKTVTGSHQLYIWDYHRVIRNFEYSLLFGLLSDLFSVEIYSYKQGHIKKDDETPITKFARYIMYSINAFSAEDYSYTISTNVKKAVTHQDGVTVSTKGNKWGPRFIGLNGVRIDISAEQTIELNKRIWQLIKHYEYKKVDNFYDRIVELIKKEYRIAISKSYISRLRSGTDEADTDQG